MVFNPAFEPALSTARLTTYRTAGRDDDHAWALYRWNLDLAAAFTALSCDVEVTLRNTIHDHLTDHFGRNDWWASTGLVLDDITNETLTEVVRRHRKQLAKGTIGPGKVIADLMLGTWVMLLGRGGTSALGRAIDYEANLWRPALRFGFATDASPLRAESVGRRAMRSINGRRTSSGCATGPPTTSRSSAGSGSPVRRTASTCSRCGSRRWSCSGG